MLTAKGNLSLSTLGCSCLPEISVHSPLIKVLNCHYLVLHVSDKQRPRDGTAKNQIGFWTSDYELKTNTRRVSIIRNKSDFSMISNYFTPAFWKSLCLLHALGGQHAEKYSCQINTVPFLNFQ